MGHHKQGEEGEKYLIQGIMSHRKIPAIKGDNVMIQAQEIELKKLSVNKG